MLQENGSSNGSFGTFGRRSPSFSSPSVASESLDSLFSRLNVQKAPIANPLERTAAKLKELRIKPGEVMADYLKCIREYTVKCIEGQYDKDFVSKARIEYVLTVPAIWTDQAKNSVIKAATTAGLGKHRADFHLVSEPEAAAVYTFRAIQPQQLRVSFPWAIWCVAGS